MNSTNCTGSSIAHQHGYNGSLSSNPSTTNHQGNLAFVAGRLLREAISRPFEAWQTYWNKPSSEQITLNRQKVIYLEGLKKFTQQLDNACARIAQNPNDSHLLRRIEKLTAEYPQYIKRHERVDFRDLQEKEFKRVETCVSKLKPSLQEKLKPLLPVVFEKMKTQKEANESSAKLSDTHKMATRETTKQKEQRDQPKEKSTQGGYQHQKRQIGECPPSTQPINLSQLNATEGFAIQGPNFDDGFGPTISTTGDLTGDNIPEFMVGAPGASPSNTTQFAGKVWIINGGQDFTKLDLSDFTSTNGVVVKGLNPYDGTGTSLAALGDFTNNGKNAIIIGAPSILYEGPQNGTAYILFAPIQDTINLASLNGNNGFQIIGSKFGDNLGCSVGGGDVNGDKIPDAVIGSALASPNGVPQAGAVYVIFGGPGPWPAQFNINNLNGMNGFVISGPANAHLGAVISVGDFDGDGIDDIAATAPGVTAPGLTGTGMVYVILGQNSTSWTSPMNVTNLNGVNGFGVYGAPSDYIGTWLNIGGDLNKDGNQDLSVGANQATPNSLNYAGKIYVLFKRPAPSTALINLPALNNTYGIEIDGTEQDDALGMSIATIDINNDGYTDLVGGMIGANPGSLPNAGSMVVLLGQANGPPTNNLSALNGINGFSIPGDTMDGQLGAGAANLGDITGDGLDDLGAAAPEVGNGTVYIILGKNTTPCPPPKTTPTTTAPTSSTTTSLTSAPTSSTTIPPSTAPGTTTHAATSAATQAPSSGSSFDVKALAIGLAVGISFLIGLVVAATVYLRFKKKGCFADEEQPEPARHDAKDLYKDL